MKHQHKCIWSFIDVFMSLDVFVFVSEFIDHMGYGILYSIVA